MRKLNESGIYGLDFILTKENNLKLVEINGVLSGMHGFKDVYGDNRIFDKVHDMISENKPVYLESPLFFERYTLTQIGFSFNVIGSYISKIKYNALKNSDRGLFDWIKYFDSSDNGNLISDSFPNHLQLDYENGTGKIINLINLCVHNDYVNPYEIEEITRNKFYSHMLMKDLGFIKNEVYCDSTFVGMGMTDDNDLERILSLGDEFIIKPILGKGTAGVKKISKNEIKDFFGTGGYFNNPNFLDYFFREILLNEQRPDYIENWVCANNFAFEDGISLIQPFYESKNSPNEFNSIRAIVCNGEFIDSYMRVSSNEVVGLSRDARAKKFESLEIKQISENVVAKIFDEPDFNSIFFKSQFYDEFFKGKNRKQILKNDSFDFSPYYFSTMFSK